MIRELFRDKRITAGLFIEDKKQLILGYTDGNVKIFNYNDSTKIPTEYYTFKLRLNDFIWTITKFDNSSLIFIGAKDSGSFVLFDLDDKKIVYEFYGQHSKLNRIFTSLWITENQLLIGSTYGELKHINITSKSDDTPFIVNIGEHSNDSIFGLAILKSKIVASGGFGGYTNIWNFESNNFSLMNKVIGIRETIQAIALEKNGEIFATLGKAGTIQIFHKIIENGIEDWVMVLRFLSGSGQGKYLTFSSNQEKLFAVTENEVIILDIKTTGIYRYPINLGRYILERDKQLLLITGNGLFELEIMEPDTTLYQTENYYKVGVIGHTSTGKSTICGRITTGKLDETLKSTKMKNVWDWIPEENKNVRIIFHDFGGQKSYIPAHLPHIIDSDLIIIVFSQRDSITFDIATELNEKLTDEYNYQNNILYIQTHGDHPSDVEDLLNNYNKKNSDKKIEPIKTKKSDDLKEIINIESVEKKVLELLNNYKPKTQINTKETNSLLLLIENYQNEGREVISLEELLHEIKQSDLKIDRNYLVYTLKGLQIQGRIELKKRGTTYSVYLNMRKISEAKNNILKRINSEEGWIDWENYLSELESEEIEYSIIAMDMLIEDKTCIEHQNQRIIIDFLKNDLKQSEALEYSKEYNLDFKKDVILIKKKINMKDFSKPEKWISKFLDLNLLMDKVAKNGGIFSYPKKITYCYILIRDDPKELFSNKFEITVYINGQFKNTLKEKIETIFTDLTDEENRDLSPKVTPIDERKEKKRKKNIKEVFKKNESKIERNGFRNNLTIDKERKIILPEKAEKITLESNINDNSLRIILICSKHDYDVISKLKDDLIENFEVLILEIDDDLIEKISNAFINFDFGLVLITTNFLNMNWKKPELDFIMDYEKNKGKLGILQLDLDNNYLKLYHKKMVDSPKIHLDKIEDIINIDKNQLVKLMIESYQIMDSNYEKLLPQIDDCNQIILESLVDRVNIILLTATQIERDSVLKLMRPIEGMNKILRGSIQSETYFLGKYGTYNVALIMTGTGSIKTILKMKAAFDFWKPKVAIMCGIAFGIKEKDQKMGDVLVSEKIIQYEIEKKSKVAIPRGAIPESSAILLDRFKNVTNWEFELAENIYSKIIIGALLSGEKVINDADFLQELINKYKQAIGGEMEGAGFYEAAKSNDIEWIIVKGICDWAFEKNDSFQLLAAKAAADLVHFVLANPNSLECLIKDS